MSAARTLAALLLALCAAPLAALEPAAPTAPAAEPAAAAEPAPAAAPFLWEVQGGPVKHYLLGSVHLLPQSAHPLPAALERAYAAADTLVFESDLGALDAPEMQKEVLAAARGKGLREEIPPELYARVQARARSYGLPESFCDPYAAWFCAMSFEIFALRGEGFDAALGLDQYFYERAAADNKSVAWFEAPREHLKLFTEMGPETGRAFLAAELDEEDDPAQQPAALLRAWRTGDVGFVERLDEDLRRESPALYERLLAARNRAWLPALSARFKLPAPQLVIVGAAHLVGPDGLVQALRLRGFEVREAGAPAPAAASPPSKNP